jgi:hypothetical protein
MTWYGSNSKMSEIDHFVANAGARAATTSPVVDIRSMIADHAAIRCRVRTADLSGSQESQTREVFSVERALEIPDRIVTKSYWGPLGNLNDDESSADAKAERFVSTSRTVITRESLVHNNEPTRRHKKRLRRSTKIALIMAEPKLWPSKQYAGELRTVVISWRGGSTQKLADKSAQADSRRSWSQFSGKPENALNAGDTRWVYSCVKRITQKALSSISTVAPLKDKLGVLKYEPKAILNVALEHCASLANDVTGLSLNFEHWEAFLPDGDAQVQVDIDELDGPITEAEIAVGGYLRTADGAADCRLVRDFIQ